MSTLALCIPAYNAARYLPRLFESVWNQTQPFDEILVYDDCSQDDTSAVAGRYGAKVFRGDVNLGCSFGKNFLARHTKCEWIHFHDADDAFKENFVAVARERIHDRDCDVVLFAYEERSDLNGEYMGMRSFDAEELESDPIAYAIKHQINPFCGLYKKSSFLRAGGYDTDPKVLYNEDVAMHCRLARAGLRFTSDDRIVVINYLRDDSMSSSNQLKCVQAQYEVMAKAYVESEENYHRIIGERLWEIAGCAAAYLDWNTADQAADLALKASGFDGIQGRLYRLLVTLLGVRSAIRIRELAIRLFKPGCRQSYPSFGFLS